MFSHSIWQSFWHLFRHSTWHLFRHFSGILSGIYFDILSGMYIMTSLSLSFAIYSDMLSGILCDNIYVVTFFPAFFLAFDLAICPALCLFGSSRAPQHPVLAIWCFRAFGAGHVVFGPRRAPQHLELAIWCLGPGVPQLWARHMAWKDRADIKLSRSRRSRRRRKRTGWRRRRRSSTFVKIQRPFTWQMGKKRSSVNLVISA